MGILDHLPASWDICVHVRKQGLELEWQTGSKSGKEYIKAVCILSSCFFSLYAEYTLRNVRLNEAQAGIKIARRNINNLWYAEQTILMTEIGELKSILMNVKRRVKMLA